MKSRARQFARHIASLGWSGGAGVAMLIAAAVLTILMTWPQVQRQSALEQELALLAAKESRQAQIRPAETPEQQMAGFRASLPRQVELNGLIETLHTLAARYHLSLKNGEYRSTPSAGGLGRLQILVKTEGNYGDLRGFLNEAQLSLPSLALGRCMLSRQHIADTTLESGLEFQLLYANE